MLRLIPSEMVLDATCLAILQRLLARRNSALCKCMQCNKPIDLSYNDVLFMELLKGKSQGMLLQYIKSTQVNYSSAAFG